MLGQLILRLLSCTSIASTVRFLTVVGTGLVHYCVVEKFVLVNVYVEIQVHIHVHIESLLLFTLVVRDFDILATTPLIQRSH